MLALANLDPHIHFGILGDFPDAPEERMPGDDEIVAAAREAIERLNAVSAGGAAGASSGSDSRGDRFFLFHRVRQWNEGEGVWMGWERKRGKIEELNRLLRGATDTSIAVQVGAVELLPRGALLHHPRLRHPPAARRRPDARSESRLIPSTARRSTRRAVGWSTATASCSRA